jgi:hypothetical protein
MNCVSGLVHELPERDHPEIGAACHLAFPVASVVRTNPLVAPEDIRIFWNEPVPAKSSLYAGVEVQIQSLPVVLSQ